MNASVALRSLPRIAVGARALSDDLIEGRDKIDEVDALRLHLAEHVEAVSIVERVLGLRGGHGGRHG